MRASPPIEISLDRYGWWRGAVAVLVAATVAATAAWAAAVWSQRDSREIAWVLAGLLLVVVIAASTARTRPIVLRWDGSTWRVTERNGSAPRVLEGRLQVSIDLGFWMLLRFVAVSSEGRSAVVWLPVQRSGLEASWHGLRCAVHAVAPDEVQA